MQRQRSFVHMASEGVLDDGEWEVTQPVIRAAVLVADTSDEEDVRHCEGIALLNSVLGHHVQPVWRHWVWLRALNEGT
jgi:hypothetical protein